MLWERNGFVNHYMSLSKFWPGSTVWILPSVSTCKTTRRSAKQQIGGVMLGDAPISNTIRRMLGEHFCFTRLQSPQEWTCQSCMSVSHL